MSAAYAPVSTGDGGVGAGHRGVAGGLRLRMRPLQLMLIAGMAMLIGLPLLAGSERREAALGMFAKSAMGGSLCNRAKSASHIPPPTGGIPASDGIPLKLDARLKHFLSLPALDQWEAELPNRYSCPMYTYARNTYFFHEGKDDKWKSVTKDDVRHYRQKMVQYFRDLDSVGTKIVWDKSMEANTGRHERRGVIYTGSGKGKDLERLKISLHFLRNVVKSKLPVEIYHYPGEFTDKAVRDELVKDFDVRIVEISIPRVDGKLWQIKNAAFIDSKFVQFVYMDSDNLPLADPNDLFESVEFKQSGSVFWPDLNKDHPDNAIWRVLGRTCSDDHWPAESGQVIFDKSANNGLNLAVLHLSNHMMEYHDAYGDLAYGDKDTYRYAFYILGLDYQQPPRMFASVGGYQRADATSSPDYFCGHAMLHWGLTPPSKRHDTNYHSPPAFLHGVLTKHRYGMQPDKLFSHVKRPLEDYISDPRLARTLYEFTGDCFAITLKGPDGLPDTPNSYLDGQGVIIEPTSELFKHAPYVWEELYNISERYALINIPGT